MFSYNINKCVVSIRFELVSTGVAHCEFFSISEAEKKGMETEKDGEVGSHSVDPDAKTGKSLKADSIGKPSIQ